MFHQFAPPEFCTVRLVGKKVKDGGKGGDNTYVLDPKTEVWSLGLILADMAGIPRANDAQNADVWVKYLSELQTDYPVPVSRVKML